MNSKTISLPEPVYERLREAKRDDESFGDAIERLLGGEPLASFWGEWSEEAADRARAAVAEGDRLSDDRLSELTE